MSGDADHIDDIQALRGAVEKAAGDFRRIAEQLGDLLADGPRWLRGPTKRQLARIASNMERAAEGLEEQLLDDELDPEEASLHSRLGRKFAALLLTGSLAIGGALAMGGAEGVGTAAWESVTSSGERACESADAVLLLVGTGATGLPPLPGASATTTKIYRLLAATEGTEYATTQLAHLLHVEDSVVDEALAALDVLLSRDDENPFQLEATRRFGNDGQATRTLVWMQRT